MLDMSDTRAYWESWRKVESDWIAAGRPDHRAEAVAAPIVLLCRECGKPVREDGRGNAVHARVTADD